MPREAAKGKNARKSGTQSFSAPRNGPASHAAPNEVEITPGMQAYIDRSREYLDDRDRYIREVVKKWKFDTIAVHGLYTVRDAIEDYQGSIIEPVFMSTAQAYRDSDEMAAALAYLIPNWCYSRIANPSTY